MGDALIFLMVMAYLAALFGLVWVFASAGSRYVRRKLGRVVVGNVKDDLKSGLAGIGSAVSGLVGCLGGLIGPPVDRPQPRRAILHDLAREAHVGSGVKGESHESTG